MLFYCCLYAFKHVYKFMVYVTFMYTQKLTTQVYIYKLNYLSTFDIDKAKGLHKKAMFLVNNSIKIVSTVQIMCIFITSIPVIKALIKLRKIFFQQSPAALMHHHIAQ